MSSTVKSAKPTQRASIRTPHAGAVSAMPCGSYGVHSQRSKLFAGGVLEQPARPEKAKFVDD